MSESQPIEIYEVVRDVLPEATVAWLLRSELAADAETAAVVEKLYAVHCAPGGWLADLEVEALAAAYLHRAREVATVEGAPVEDFGEIPGPLPELCLEVLRGFGSRAALREHCRWGESRAGAALLNLAVCWSRGRSASAWCYEEVRRVLTGDPHEEPVGLAVLRELERGSLAR